MTIRDIFQSDTLIWQGHRGASAQCPENTLPAFHKAVELGADMIELDVRLTKDNQIIVMHDGHLNRTTNGTGRVIDKTLAEIRDLDAGSWFDTAFSGTRVPTLSEVFAELPNVRLNIEMKTAPVAQAEPLVSKVIECALDMEALDRVLLSSFDHEAVYLARRMNKEVALGAIYYGRLWPNFALADELQLTSLHGDVENIDGAFSREAKRRGYGIVAWTVKNRDALAWCIEQEVNCVTVDDLTLRVAQSPVHR